jgi:hypothetical protein
MPEVFSTRDAISVWGIGRSHADRMIHDWRAKGLIRTMGQRKAAVHFNLVRSPDGPGRLLHDACWKLLGRPTVLVGGMALNAGGWTTQLHRIHEVCTGVTAKLPTVPTGMDGIGLRVLPRPPAWMNALIRDAERNGEGFGGFPLASPAMALADAVLAHARGVGPGVNAPLPWRPDPDDAEIPDDAAFEAFEEALGALGAAPDEIGRLAEDYRASVFDSDRGWRR